MVWLVSHTSENPTILHRYSTAYALVILSSAAMATLATAICFGPLFTFVDSRRGPILTVFLATLAAGALADLMVRTFDPIGVSYYEESRRYHLAKVPDAQLYFRHEANLDTSYQGVRVKTNSIGFRDDEISDKRTGEFRILFLGDSVTFGWGVEAQDTFSERTGRLLQADSSLLITAINSGVGGYNTTNEAAVLTRHGDVLQPDLVVLTYVGNDLDESSPQPFDPQADLALTGKSPPQIIQMWLWNSWTYRLLTHALRYRSSDDVASRFDPDHHKGWLESKGSLLTIVHFCQARHIPLVLVLFRMGRGEPLDTLARLFDQLAVSDDFVFADTVTWFEGVDERVVTNSIVDSHPNAKGHQILAAGISKVIMARGVGPPTSMSPDAQDQRSGTQATTAIGPSTLDLE